MKLFNFRGGVHPNDNKDLTSSLVTQAMPLPALLHVPMQQHIGVAATPVVRRGDEVLKGQLIGDAHMGISAKVHAPTSGTVVEIGDYIAPHPSGMSATTVTIKPDGRDEWGELLPPLEPFSLDGTELAERVAQCGIVGMGGAAFPSAVKLNAKGIETLIINGAECEPYITADERLMRERTNEIMDGVQILRHALGVSQTYIGIEDNKPEAFRAIKQATSGISGIEVTMIPTRYPGGSERNLIQMLTGHEVPSGEIPASVGMIVHNIGTTYAIHNAIRHGIPLISRIVTVSGRGIKKPANMEVLIGTPIADLIEYCGGLINKPDRFVIGGPMMGTPISDTDAPVIKGTTAILALTKEEAYDVHERPCIRCGKCVEVCSCGLAPLDLAVRIRKEKIDAAAEIGLSDCVSCGTCSYICPSHIPLSQYFDYGKAKLREQIAIERDQQMKSELADQRLQRLEKQAEEKRKVREARKAKMQQKRKKERENA
jgi:electron transport complex protein RnfC